MATKKKPKEQSAELFEKDISLDMLESLARSIPFPRLLKIPKSLQQTVTALEGYQKQAPMTNRDYGYLYGAYVEFGDYKMISVESME